MSTARWFRVNGISIGEGRNERTLVQYRARYEAGESVLKGARIVATHRFRDRDREGESELAKLTRDLRLLSEPVLMEGGHIATRTAYRYVVLAELDGAY